MQTRRQIQPKLPLLWPMQKAGLADTAALAANTAKEDAIAATDNANTAADRANRAAEAAEGAISGLQPDWNVTDPVNKNYIRTNRRSRRWIWHRLPRH